MVMNPAAYLHRAEFPVDGPSHLADFHADHFVDPRAIYVAAWVLSASQSSLANAPRFRLLGHGVRWFMNP
jgi:hypothetical protein